MDCQQEGWAQKAPLLCVSSFFAFALDKQAQVALTQHLLALPRLAPAHRDNVMFSQRSSRRLGAGGSDSQGYAINWQAYACGQDDVWNFTFYRHDKENEPEMHTGVQIRL